ncbi:MAG: non-canonical purine NTP diphosphatase [Bacteroidales bacterium]|nr:non-canonical purine NTP diphosphatase [Bacteroidales bacterium]
MKTLVFATNNKHKLEEIQAAVGNGLEIKSLKDIGCNEEIPEPYETLEENARAKSQYIHDKFGFDCFADDTGLEIEALNGRPGVYSARYAGDACTPDDNIRKVLEELNGIDNRKAQFRTVISLILDGKEYQFEGIAKGEIIEERIGKDGFGYDPVFRPEDYQETFAEMAMDLKNQISHRGRAVRKLIEFLKQL